MYGLKAIVGKERDTTQDTESDISDIGTVIHGLALHKPRILYKVTNQSFETR